MAQVDEPGTVSLSPSGAELRFQRARLEVVAGPDQGAVVDSDAPELVVGADEGATLALRDATVSRHHLAITATPQGFLLRDLGSKNGTRIGGLRVEVVYLRSGTLLEVGQTTVRFTALDEEL